MEKNFFNKIYDIKDNKCNSNIRFYNKIYTETCSWSNLVNLTRNLKPGIFFRENIIDPTAAFSAYIKQYKTETNFRILDVGCGGGYVGFIWYMELSLHGQPSLTLLDSNKKKISFCKNIIIKQELIRCLALQKRAEEYCVSPDQTYDIVLCRAVWSDYRIAYKVCSRFVKPGGKFVIFSGKHESKLPTKQVCAILPYQLNLYGINRNLLVFHI